MNVKTSCYGCLNRKVECHIQVEEHRRKKLARLEQRIKKKG
nr:MAG TPA: hypothetical protein [Caudoviricetes sp.]